PALQTLWQVVQSEARALLGALLVMISLILFAATGIYFIERHVQPEHFGSIPAAAWWALATLTTVGYGDVVPVTTFGRFFGGLIMIFGLGMFALPIAIIATGFSQQTGRRAFVVTWSMVAQVPMFRGLEPGEIAEITTLLQSQSLAPETVIYRIGEPAEAMYFILSGDVRIDRKDKTFVLGQGEFFGELALLEKREHGADAITASRTSLLALSLEDLEFLLRHNPHINQRLREEAQLRLSEGELEKHVTQ
ncbi:MAG: cyclic nucleotide-gated ion channel, partial [Methyloligellaceae bacterium]